MAKRVTHLCPGRSGFAARRAVPAGGGRAHGAAGASCAGRRRRLHCASRPAFCASCFARRRAKQELSEPVPAAGLRWESAAFPVDLTVK
jgi:hypothetical protein